MPIEVKDVDTTMDEFDMLSMLDVDDKSIHHEYNEYRKQWRLDNPDKVKAQQQKHYYNNREKEVNRVKLYNSKNKQKKKEYNKKYKNEHYEELIAKSNVWKRRNKDKVKIHSMRKHVKRNYRITLDEYLERAQAQNGQCAICGGTDNLALDHCHKTNKIREFLCIKCNVGLGNFKENETLLLKAVEYILKHRGS